MKCLTDRGLVEVFQFLELDSPYYCKLLRLVNTRLGQCLPGAGALSFHTTDDCTQNYVLSCARVYGSERTLS